MVFELFLLLASLAEVTARKKRACFADVKLLQVCMFMNSDLSSSVLIFLGCSLLINKVFLPVRYIQPPTCPTLKLVYRILRSVFLYLN